MLQAVKSLPFHRLKRCQTALKPVKTAPFPPFSVPSDTVSDGEKLNFLPSGASMVVLVVVVDELVVALALSTPGS